MAGQLSLVRITACPTGLPPIDLSIEMVYVATIDLSIAMVYVLCLVASTLKMSTLKTTLYSRLVNLQETHQPQESHY